MRRPIRIFSPFFSLMLVLLSAFAGNAAPHELVIAAASPPHFNPLILTGQMVGSVGAQLFAGLTRLAPDGTPLPYLASSWTESRDRLSFLFRLRENAAFHDGVPVTAEDVAFSILAGKRYHPFHPMLEPVVAVETPDPHTVLIRLSRPYPVLPKILIPSLVPILPRHVYDDGTPLPVHPANLHPVGSGPFMLEAFIPDQELRLKRNPHFFLPGRPLLDRIVYRFFWDQSEVPSAMVCGGVDVYPFASPTFLKSFNRSYPFGAIRATAFANLNAHILIKYNLRRKPFSDRKVRKAVALAVDLPKLAEHLENRLTPQYGPIPPGAPCFSPISSRTDIDRANRLLDEAGYPRGPEGTRFTMLIDYIPGTDFFPSVLHVLRSDLERVGIDVQVHDSPNFAEWAHRIATGRYQATLDGLFAWHDPAIGIHRLYTPNPTKRNVIWSNTDGYDNPAVPPLLRQASSAADPQERKALYARFQRLVAEDHPSLWLAAIPYLIIHTPGVRHLETTGLGILSPLDAVDTE